MRAFARQVVPGLWLTGFRVAGDAAHISLKGHVTRPELLPAYIQKLGREPVMQGRNFSNLKMQQPEADTAKGGAKPHYVSFELSSNPDGEAKK